MATNSFERKIELDSVESVKKIIELEQYADKKKNFNPYTATERKRSEELLKRCLSRSRH